MIAKNTIYPGMLKCLALQYSRTCKQPKGKKHFLSENHCWSVSLCSSYKAKSVVCPRLGYHRLMSGENRLLSVYNVVLVI